MKVSAYIPCFNNRETLSAAIASLRAQGPEVDEILVIDDGSCDGSADLAVSHPGVRVIRHEQNLGRGAARATAFAEARHELVLSCDATGVLDPEFVRRALQWFDHDRVAAVTARVTQPPARNAVERWRGRWLFRLDGIAKVRHQASLATHGAMMRASAVQRAGGYARHLRHGEDADLGRRLLQAGFDVVYDPHLIAVSGASNTLGQVLERYSRWNSDQSVRTGIRDYLRQVWYSIKVMALRDLRASDPAAAVISLLSPHYQFWRTRTRSRPQATPPNAARIAVCHPEFRRRRAECRDGLYPRNQLWGIEALEAAGFTVEFVQPDAHRAVAALCHAVSRLTRGRVPDLRTDLAILRRHRHATAIYASTGGLFLVPLLRALGLFRPLVFTWVFGPPATSPWWRFRALEFRALPRRGYDGIVCLVAKAETWFREWCPGALVRQIEWGADLNLFVPSRERRHGTYFLAVGKTLRDYATLLQACEGLDWPVRVIAPAGSVAGCRIPDNVAFLEGTADPPDAAISYGELRHWYDDAIAVLVPLLADPDDTCGLTNMLEAMAMGRPIIKTQSGCLDLDVEALGVGLHVPPGDVNAWRDAMQSLAADPRRASEMGARGRELARTRFNLDRFERDLVQFTRDLLDR